MEQGNPPSAGIRTKCENEKAAYLGQALVVAQEGMFDALRNGLGREYLSHKKAYDLTAEANPDVVAWLKGLVASEASRNPKRAAGAAKALPEYFENQVRRAGFTTNVREDKRIDLCWEVLGAKPDEAKKWSAAYRAVSNVQKASEYQQALHGAAEFAANYVAAKEKRGEIIYGGQIAVLRRIEATTSSLKQNTLLVSEVDSSVDAALCNATIIILQEAEVASIDEPTARGLFGSLLMQNRSINPALATSKLILETAAMTKSVMKTAASMTPDATATGRIGWQSEFLYFIKDALDVGDNLFDSPAGFNAWFGKASSWYFRNSPILDNSVSKIAREQGITSPMHRIAIRNTLQLLSASESGLVHIKDVQIEINKLAKVLGVRVEQLKDIAGNSVKPSQNLDYYGLRESASRGDVDAQLQVANCLFQGNGVQKNVQEGLSWCRKSAQGGNVKAQGLLGMLYGSKPSIVEVDYAESVKWFRMAARQGDHEAEYFMGLAYANGKGVDKDIVEAARWFGCAKTAGGTIGADAEKTGSELIKSMTTEQWEKFRSSRPMR